MQNIKDVAVSILGIARGLAVDLALNACRVDVIDIKPRSDEERRSKADE